jgi:leader peptidase (prepilin peptidase)/N-methyltransferase
MPDHVWIIVVLAVIGLVIGPFVGIVVDRAVARERPEPEHRCPECGAGLGSASLVPIRSWFVRCPVDAGHRQWRYGLVDLSLAASFALAGWRFGSAWLLAPYLVLFVSFVAMSVIDLEEHLLLNILTYPTLGLGLFMVLALSAPNGYEAGIWPALTGAGMYALILGIAFLAYPPGLGLGDVKLAPTLGLAMGWLAADSLAAVRMVLYSLILGFLALGVIGLIHGRRSGQGAKAELPAGPFLVLGALVLIAASDPSISALGAAAFSR